MRSNYFAVILSLILILPVSGVYAQESAIYADEKKASEAPLNIDFTTYQKDIDDLFQIALMQSPTMNSGINNVILNLNRKITENPENPSPVISLAHVYRLLGQPTEANRFYEKALELDPDNFHLNVFSALTSSQTSQYEEALERLEKATQLNPLDLYAWMTKGRVLMILKRDEEALACFQKANEIDPDQRQAAFAMSLIYQKLGREEEALAVLEELKRKNPDDLFIQYHLGALAFAQGNAEEALEHWQNLFNEGVRDTRFLFNLSMAFLEGGEPAKAEKILEHLEFFLPGEVDVDIMIAESFRLMNRLDDAERRFRVILAENPGQLSAYMGLAQVLDEEGKHEERDQILQEAAVYAQHARTLAEEKKRMDDFREDILGDPDAPGFASSIE